MIDVYRALGDPHRFAIVEMALAAPRYVQELADELGITQPAVSRHVRVLREAGIVDVVREGRKSVLVCPAEAASAELRTLLTWIGVEEAPPSGRAGPRDGRSRHEGSPPEPSPKAPSPSRPAVRDEIEDYLL